MMPRRRPPRSHAAALALLTALSLGLSSCSSPLAERAMRNGAREHSEATEAAAAALTFGPPVPAGAIMERPGGRRAAEEENPVADKAEGSLRPDAAEPRERIPEIVARGRLIVGVDQSLYRISYRDPRYGDVRGFEVDLAREIARDIFGDPSKVEFRFMESADSLDSLNRGTVDAVIRTMSITAQRQETIAFSAPYLSTHKRLLVSTNADIESAEDLSGRTVCVADGSTGLIEARAQAPHSSILKTRSWSDCLVALQQHQTDAILADDVLLSGIAAQDQFTHIVGPALSQEDYGVAMARPEEGGNPGLVRQVNATLERIRADDTWWDMYNRWFGPYLTSPGPPPLDYRPEEQIHD
ncbi:glutamate ABC transporter substrate-binding protein [Corynebacterium sp. zg-331]|uniref:glutamate ABC transporter substrate-binding protein n=1 Tax=unclassified Corynebacterium TaxID=2624378 RepID=UPI00128C6E53|nr:MULTISPECIES: glutamate ABC transporter substrate-binding protein [unclassified Corynebacterium]MBC3185745.1 glutamate ABC transporter substrate-binding protein [Corynebacterium sp. zg-331]MPV52238.1 transporter substrate-binding domain-containing protein [Corynebacterium sp. zg331]